MDNAGWQISQSPVVVVRLAVMYITRQENAAAAALTSMMAKRHVSCSGMSGWDMESRCTHTTAITTARVKCRECRECSLAAIMMAAAAASKCSAVCIHSCGGRW